MRNLSTTGKNLENPLPTSLKPMRLNEKLNQAARARRWRNIPPTG